MLLLRSIFFTVMIPGTVTVFIPYYLLSAREQDGLADYPKLRFVGLPLILIGSVALLWSIWQFYAEGHGTLATVDAPKLLVVKGLYRYVRNPMYVGVLAILLGEAIFFRARPILLEAGTFLLITHLFITYYEEPTLLKQFGESYASYARKVNRWIPHFRHR